MLASGCAPINYQWSKPGATVQSFERNKAECIYQTAASTSITAGSTVRSTGGAAAQGMFEGLAEHMRREELSMPCMQAKGYTWHWVP